MDQGRGRRPLQFLPTCKRRTPPSTRRWISTPVARPSTSRSAGYGWPTPYTASASSSPNTIRRRRSTKLWLSPRSRCFLTCMGGAVWPTTDGGARLVRSLCTRLLS